MTPLMLAVFVAVLAAAAAVADGDLRRRQARPRDRQLIARKDTPTDRSHARHPGRRTPGMAQPGRSYDRGERAA